MSQLSPSEKRGLLVLLGIILIGFVIQWLQPFMTKTDLYDYSVQDSIFKAVSADTAVNIASSYQTENTKILPRKTTFKKPSNNVLSLHSININSANQTELEKLPRIGPATAKNILEYRARNGRFKSIDELVKVKRIGPKTLETIKPYLTLE